MIFFRSFLFQLALYVGGGALFVLATPLLLLPSKFIEKFARFWSAYVLFLLRTIVRLDVKVEGFENLPKDGRYIIASNHQSAWETQVIFSLLPHTPVAVQKKILSRVPILGVFLIRAGMISIDRQNPSMGMRKFLSDVKDRLSKNRPVVIFPEGTRVSPFKTAPFQRGIDFLYKNLDVPVLPVVHNAGIFWKRRAFQKSPGCVTFKILPLIASEKNVNFLKDLETTINQEKSHLEKDHSYYE